MTDSENNNTETLLYADADLSQHVARTDQLAKKLLPLKIITAETGESVIDTIVKDTGNQIVAVVLSQTLGKGEIRDILALLDSTTPPKPRFILTTGSPSATQELLRFFALENKDPGMVIEAAVGPIEIATRVRNELARLLLILPLSTDTFDPSETQPMERPTFTEPNNEDPTTKEIPDIPETPGND